MMLRPEIAGIVGLVVAGIASIGVWLRRRSRLMAPFPEVAATPHRSPEQHPHEHGEACGHPAVQHGDHVDYVHDGHRHAVHGEHYDEH